jgi:hypothetical protein
MAVERSEHKRYFRLTVNCDTHGQNSPAFHDWEVEYGNDVTCCRCGIEELLEKAAELEATHLEGGAEDWEWLPGQAPADRSQWHIGAKEALAFWSSSVLIEAAQRKSIFTPYLQQSTPADQQADHWETHIDDWRGNE